MNTQKLILVIGSGLLFSSCRPKDERPNILLILADDMGYSDIGCYGSEISTPNLDSLAYNGMRMTQFYNASRSCPSRASLLTGLYQHQAGIGDMVKNLGHPAYQGYLNDSCVTIAEVLKNAGYNTYMCGKWHVGDTVTVRPMARGFKRFFGLVDGASSYFDLKKYRQSHTRDMMMLIDDEAYNPPQEGFYMTDAFTDYALQFLDEQKNSRKPFFFYLAYTAPHWPLHALPEDINKYKGRYMIGWDSLRVERYKRMLSLGVIDSLCALSPRDEKVPAWNSLDIDQQIDNDLRMAVYAAMIDRMDQNIGRIIRKLKEQKKFDNTLIIFISDNGGCHENISQQDIIKREGKVGTRNSFDSYNRGWANVSNTPFRMFKHWVHEGGISTPCIISYPGVCPKGSICTVPLHIIDLMPTFVELAQANYPSIYRNTPIHPMEGISMMPFIRGKNSYGEDHPAQIWEHEGNKALRKGLWKVVSKFDYDKNQSGPWELYNMYNDRAEQHDLSHVHANICELLVSWYEKWEKHVHTVPYEQLHKK